MEHIYINTFKEGTKVSGIYALRELKEDVASNNSKYLNITICDNSGDLKCKLWNSEKINTEDFKDTSIIAIEGSVSTYKGSLQLTLTSIRKTTETDSYNLETLLPTSPENPNDLLEEILTTVNSFENEEIKKVVLYTLTNKKEDFLKFPAAKGVHHAFIGGLAQHTCGMLRLATSISSLYSKLINRDLLLAGVILHDIAKIAEFETNNLGLVCDYTKKGKLLGHLYMGGSFIMAVCNSLKISEEVSTLLQHMVISHHGKPEWGACKVPATIEADMLSLIDLIDAHVYMFDLLFKNMENGEFQKSYLFGTEVYRHQLTPISQFVTSVEQKDMTQGAENNTEQNIELTPELPQEVFNTPESSFIESDDCDITLGDIEDFDSFQTEQF